MTKSKTDAIHKQLVLKAPPSRVWQAISNAEQFGTWPDCFQAALTSDWAAHPGPTSSHCALCAARLKRPKTSRRTFLRCRPSWLQPVQISASGLCRPQERKCRCGF